MEMNLLATACDDTQNIQMSDISRPSQQEDDQLNTNIQVGLTLIIHHVNFELIGYGIGVIDHIPESQIAKIY